mmetsp:Transcript_133058/g.332110  ORF Transcript_133058/g.332110 Transcript_133058/m.332110 type:complete len:225 (+) Transcript_133058:804-1478(+)
MGHKCLPNSQKDTGIKGCIPPAPVSHGQGARDGHCHDLSARAVPIAQGNRDIAEDDKAFTTEDADSLAILCPEQAAFVARRHHQGKTEEPWARQLWCLLALLARGNLEAPLAQLGVTDSGIEGLAQRPILGAWLSTTPNARLAVDFPASQGKNPATIQALHASPFVLDAVAPLVVPLEARHTLGLFVAILGADLTDDRGRGSCGNLREQSLVSARDHHEAGLVD